MGRPTKLNEDTHKAIVDALTIGATRKDAALSAGVVYTTFLTWMQKGEKAKSGRYHDFNNACRIAEGTARLNFTAVIAKAANSGDWRAAMEYLKRRDRDNWSERQEITGADGSELEIKLTWGDE